MLVGLVALGVMVPEAALADTQHPSGCVTWAQGTARFNWQANCWLGRDSSKYERNAHYVIGVQRILRGSGFYSGSNDGIFGVGTENGVKAYQTSASGLSPDGIVGTNTWDHMQLYKLVYEGVNDANYFYYRVQGSSNNSLSSYKPVPYYWWTRNTTNSAWAHFDVLGPT